MTGYCIDNRQKESLSQQIGTGLHLMRHIKNYGSLEMAMQGLACLYAKKERTTEDEEQIRLLSRIIYKERK